MVGLTDTAGNKVVEYFYDAWGNIIRIGGTMANTLGQDNPLRYRGYVYDQETGLYYLQSRYYNPQVGRFINADALASTGQGVLGNNMFAYCQNNPVNYQDPTGEIAISTIILIGSIVVGVLCAGTTAYVEYEAGVDTFQIVGDSICAGLTGFSIVYSGGMALYQCYQNYCYLSSLTSATSIGTVSVSSVQQTGVGFDTFAQLKKEIGSPGVGNQWHHIVEQSQIIKSGFNPQIIHNTNNIIAIDIQTHKAISAYYSSIQPFTDGIIVRNWLAGQSFSSQYEFGLEVIKIFS